MISWVACILGGGGPKSIELFRARSTSSVHCACMCACVCVCVRVRACACVCEDLLSLVPQMVEN